MFPIRGTVRRERFPLVTVSLIAANVLVFWYEMRTSQHLQGLFYQ